MTALVVDFVAARSARLARTAALSQPTPAKPASSAGATPATDFKFWVGASGRRYVHTIHTLLTCPEVPNANYILVRRREDGRRTVLRIGCLSHDAPSLNLAEIRQDGATLGANEVHVHLIAETEAQRRFIELDLSSGLSLSSGAATA